MPIDLFELARGSAGAIEVQYLAATQLDGSDLPELTSQFASVIASTALVSMNLRQMELLRFLQSGEYGNIWDWAESVHRRSGKPVVETLEERLKHFSSKRIAFDDAFINGRRFLYGAVNIGGMGTSAYGEYCITLREETFS